MADENETETPTTREGAAHKLQRLDPTARELWNVQGPRDTPSRIAGWLTRRNGALEEIIIQSFEGPEARADLVYVQATDDIFG